MWLLSLAGKLSWTRKLRAWKDCSPPFRPGARCRPIPSASCITNRPAVLSSIEGRTVKVSIVAGCDAVDAGQDWVRLRVPGGALRTIPWSGIRMAALPPNNSHMTFEGDLAEITSLAATHDALWIECPDGVDVALLEKTHPRRDSIVRAFQERLES